MKYNNLQARLAGWEENLAVVEQALDRESQKYYSCRRLNLLLFLYREKVVCISVIFGLRALAGEEEAAARKESEAHV